MASSNLGGRRARQLAIEAKLRHSCLVARPAVLGWLAEFGLAPNSPSAQLTPASFKRDVAVIQNRIVEAGWAPSVMMHAFRELSRATVKLIEVSRLPADPFVPPVRLTRSSTFRNERWFHRHGAADAWDARFREQLCQARREERKDRAFWAGLVLWSAVARGFLCEPLLLEALAKRLLGNGRLLDLGFNERPVVLLKIEVSSGEANEASEGAYFRRVAWPPDGLTLALIRRVQECPGAPPDLRALELIRMALWDGAPPVDFSQLSALALAACWLGENRSGVRVPQILVEVATGRQSSQSLDRMASLLVRGKVEPQAGPPARLETTEKVVDGEEPKAADFVSNIFPHLRIIDGDGQKISAEKVKSALATAIPLFPERSMERLLIAWFLALLEKRRKVSTIARYNAWVSLPLLEECSGRDLASFDADDFENLYGLVVDSSHSQGERLQRAGRLQQLHDFGRASADFQLPPLIDRLAVEGARVKVVRARHIPYQAYTALRQTLREAYGDGAWGDTLDLILVIAWRGGLRIGEIIKLCVENIEASAERTLFIRNTRFGNNKSPAALRQIPLAQLLMRDERELLSRVLRSNPKPKASPNTPFFREPGSKRPLESGALRRIFTEAMHHTFGGDGWTFHHLRHAAFNNLFLALESEDALAQDMSGWPPEQQAQIRLAVIGDGWSRQKRFYALAAFAGHSTPMESFSSYIHLTREVIAERVGRMEIAGDIPLYAEALRLAPERLVFCRTDGEIRRLVAKKLKFPAETALGLERLQKPAPRALKSPDDEVWVAFQALTLIEQGATIEEAAFAQGVLEDRVALWVQNAKHLAGLTSRKGAARLVTRKRAARTARNPNKFEILLPTELKTEAERRDAKAAITAFREVAKRDRDLADWAIAYGLRHSVQSKSGVRFRQIEDLTRFLSLFERAPFAGGRWHLSVRLSDLNQIPLWARKLPKGATYHVIEQKSVATKRKGWKRGHCVLHLRGGEVGPQAVKRSSPALRFALHMMGIVSGPGLSVE